MPRQVAVMPLDQFAGANLILEVDSPLLGERVWFVSGEAEVQILLARGILRGMIYSAEELLTLLNLPGMDQAKMRHVHEAKEMFNGVLRQVERP